MTDSPRRDVPDPTQPMPYGYPGHADPAYANQAPYGSPYQAPPPPNSTQQMPPYQGYGYDPYTGPPYPPGGKPPGPPEPNGRGPRVWLWALAAVAVVVVIGLVIALVIVNSSQQDTVFAPPPAPLEPNFTTPSTTTTRVPTTTRSSAVPTPPSATTTAPTTPAGTDTVVYDVSGSGRAINITYVDAGGVLQTEFNVMLPWSKEVQLTAPADRSASVSVINVGREISCSITLDGTQIQQRTGSGLTVCSGLG